MRRLLTLLAMLVLITTVASPAAAAPAAPVSATAAYAELGRTASIPGTSWWTDAQTGAVVVSADSTVTGHDLVALSLTVRRLRATLVREPGTLARRIAGGDLFFGPVAARCNIGFNVRALPTFYFLTSAHCVGLIGATVYADAGHTVVLGVIASSSPANDYALVRYTNAIIAKPSSVDLHNGLFQPITSVAGGFVGQAVKRSGSTTGVHSGTITALNATVNYADGTVFGLIRTNVCAEPGDSGGPLFAGAIAIGLLSGGSGNCTSGGTTYFASALRAMNTYGVSVY